MSYGPPPKIPQPDMVPQARYWHWVVAATLYVTGAVGLYLYTNREQEPDRAEVFQQMTTSLDTCNDRRSPLLNIGAVDIDSFGGTYDGRVGYFLPATLAGEFRLVDMSQGKVEVKAHVFIDPVTHGIIVEVDGIRIGFL